MSNEEIKQHDITAFRSTFKPFKYPWAYDAWLVHEQMHWLHTELDFAEDVNDFKRKLTADEKEFLTKVLRFFVQGDIDIGGAYLDGYVPIFKQPEVRMMMSGFAAREALHVAAYAHLIETLGLSEETYNEFLNYAEMLEKHEYLNDVVNLGVPEKIAKVSAFGEGMQLFSSFVMLLNFQRNGKMKNVGQIIAWSIRDETQHAEGMIKVFNEYVDENPESFTAETEKNIYQICEKMVELEDKFIDLAFGMHDAKRLKKEDVKKYIRYIADRRLISMGLDGLYKVKKNPLPWVEEMLGKSHANFFEQKSTDYAKGALKGSWAEVWAK